MVSAPFPVEIPTDLLNHTLGQLDEAETDRLYAAQNGTVKNDSDYSNCSYTVKISTEGANKRDNRWANIFPYDHSLLPGPYLNASLIPPYPYEGSPSRRSYIASQAPLPHALPTFYSHTVNSKVSLVVNLSPFVEHGRVKADEYWPLRKGQTWEKTPGFKITQRQDPHKIEEKQWQANQYKLRLSSEKQGGQDYDFDLLHVTSWPDFGAFSSKIFAKLLTVIEETATGQGPVLVHCSAGIGRSGTVIAALLARDLGSSIGKAMQLGSLSTPSMVREAALMAAKRTVDHERRYRPHMVQTAEQLGMVASAIGTLLQQQQQQQD